MLPLSSILAFPSGHVISRDLEALAATRRKVTERAGVCVGCLGICQFSVVLCCIAAAARSFVLPPTVAAYFLDANNDGNPVTAEPRVIFTLNGNCAEMSDIIVDLEERVAWHWPNLMHLETTLRLLDNRQNPR